MRGVGLTFHHVMIYFWTLETLLSVSPTQRGACNYEVQWHYFTSLGRLWHKELRGSRGCWFGAWEHALREVLFVSWQSCKGQPLRPLLSRHLLLGFSVLGHHLLLLPGRWWFCLKYASKAIFGFLLPYEDSSVSYCAFSRPHKTTSSSDM